MIDTTGPGLFYRECSQKKTTWAGSPSAVIRTERGLYPDRYGAPKDVTLVLTGIASADFWLQQEISNPSNIAALFPVPLSQAEAYARGRIEWGSIDPHIDLPRSIAELKDFAGVFKSLLRSLKRIAGSFKGASLRDVLENVSVELKRQGSTIESRLPKNAGELLDTGISADLTWKFAIAPLISDVQRVMELSKKAEQLMTRLLTVEEFPVRGRFVQTQTASKTFIPSSGAQKASIHLDGTHTCVAWAMIRTSPVSLSNIEALRAVAGIRFQWRTVWELVPLSFVIDWFIKVGNLVSTLDRGTGLQRPFEVVSSGYSHKQEFTGAGNVTPLPTAAIELGAPWIATPVANSRVEVVSYSRVAKIISPSDAGLPPPLEYSLPNLGQVLTLVELITSFVRR